MAFLFDPNATEKVINIDLRKFQHAPPKLATRFTKHSQSPSLEREAVIENHSVLSSERIPLLRANWISAM